MNYKADGTPFWNQFFVAALRDDTGKVFAIVNPFHSLFFFLFVFSFFCCLSGRFVVETEHPVSLPVVVFNFCCNTSSVLPYLTDFR